MAVTWLNTNWVCIALIIGANERIARQAHQHHGFGCKLLPLNQPLCQCQSCRRNSLCSKSSHLWSFARLTGQIWLMVVTRHRLGRTMGPRLCSTRCASPLGLKVTLSAAGRHASMPRKAKGAKMVPTVQLGQRPFFP
eukprot:g8095.t1